jgi:hypothetical protein
VSGTFFNSGGPSPLLLKKVPDTVGRS